MIAIAIDHSYGRDVARGVARFGWSAAKPPWRVSLSPIVDLGSISPHDYDGLILAIYSDDLARQYSELRKPIVNVSGILAHSLWPRVTWDNVAIGRIVGDHYYSRGYRRFAFIGMYGAWFSTLRQGGFRSALKKYGCSVTTFTGSIDATWLTRETKPLAVFAANDELGCAAIETCEDNGIAVPREVAVIGVGNDNLLCETIQPSLSSVSVSGEPVGFEAARILEQRMDGNSVPTEIYLAPRHVITRRSSDFLATSDPLVLRALEILADSLPEPINVSDLADRLYASRSTVERAFRRGLGCSPLRVIHIYRLERAKMLLSATKWPLQRIAETCGFGTATRLIETFKRHFGETPTDFRLR